MPYLGEADASDPVALEILAALDTMPACDWDVAAALNVFEHCRAVIARSLDAKPASATLALVQRIRAMG